MIDENMQAILQNTHAVKLVENMTEADWPPTGSVTLPDGTVITYTKTVQAPSP